MNNLIKLASFELGNHSQDVIKTAGILRMLKNKLLQLFDKQKAAEAAKMVSTTTNMKPLLRETYMAIKDIESAINDLDINSYNENINKLKSKLSELGNVVNAFDKVSEPKGEGAGIKPEVGGAGYTPPKEETPPPSAAAAAKREEALKREDIPIEPIKPIESAAPSIAAPVAPSAVAPSPPPKPSSTPAERHGGKRSGRIERAPLSDEDKKLYAGKNTLSELGVTINDINISEENYRAFSAYWAGIYNKVAPKELLELFNIQQKVTNENIKDAIYSQIPHMKIDRVLGRSLNADGDKKSGILELKLVSDLLPLKPPVDNIKIRLAIVLVEMYRKSFNIFTQTILAIYDSNTGKTYR